MPPRKDGGTRTFVPQRRGPAGLILARNGLGRLATPAQLSRYGRATVPAILQR